VTRYWLAVAIAATVALAWFVPEPAVALTRLYLLDIGVVLIMFLGSLKLTPSRFKEAARRPHLVALAVVSTFALAPLVALGVAWVVGFSSQTDRLAVLICATQASTLATAIVLTEIAGGDMALAMVITVVNNFVTVLATPLAFLVLGRTEVAVDHTAMGLEIALKIVAPVLCAQLVRPLLASFTAAHGRKFSIVSQVIILMYVYAGVAAGSQRLAGRGDVLPRLVLLAVALHVVLLGLNSALARLTMKSSGSRTAFVLCTSQKTLPAAILIWKSYFAALPLGPVVAVTYHLTQLVIDSIIAPGFRKLPLVRERRR
jgi:sodium/bile acid cotransporter 7